MGFFKMEGVVFHATIKGDWYSYDLDYVISFLSWILSAFCGISTFRGYYLNLVDVSVFFVYYLHFVDIIRIGQITSYLARNVCHGLHSFVLLIDIIYIGHIMSYLARNVYTILHIYSFI